MKKPPGGETPTLSCLNPPWSPIADSSRVPDGGLTICMGTVSSSTLSLKYHVVVAAATLSHAQMPYPVPNMAWPVLNGSILISASQCGLLPDVHGAYVRFQVAFSVNEELVNNSSVHDVPPLVEYHTWSCSHHRSSVDNIMLLLFCASTDIPPKP
jgi:hypothetical protein